MIRWVAVVGAIAVAATPIGAAGATEGSSGTGIDFSTRAGIERYAVSIGVDPDSLVIQRGPRNYVGPDCPGSGWNCTTASNVLQITSNGINEADCDTSPESTTALPVITQTNVDGDNHASCEWKSNESGEQAFELTQTNVNGDNHAQFLVELKDEDDSIQVASQAVEAEQTNQRGDNHLVIEETMELITKTGPSQTQDGLQSADVFQDAETGDNFLQVKQVMLEQAFHSGEGSITQMQNTDSAFPFCGGKSSPNQCADIEQVSTGGKDEFQLDQEIELEATAEGTIAVGQTQGHFGGGIAGSVFQDGMKVSTFVGSQEETQKRFAPSGAPGATQIIDPNCCAFQTGNPDHFAQIHQKAEQQSTPDNSVQEATNEVDCDSSGRCQAQSQIVQNGETNTFECDDSSCFYVQFCARGGEGSCFVDEGGGSEPFAAQTSRRGG